VGVLGENEEFRTEVFVKPATLQTAIRVNGRPTARRGLSLVSASNHQKAAEKVYKLK
jgi:hypothetical protein